MGAGQEGDFGAELAQLIEGAAIHTLALVEGEIAHGLDLEVVKGGAVLLLGHGFEFRLHLLFELVLDGVDLVLALNLIGDGEGFDEGRSGQLTGRDKELGFAGGFFDDLLRQSELAAQLKLGGDDLVADLLAEVHRGDDVGFADFLAIAFDHHGYVLLAAIDEVEVALLAFVMRGVDDELAIDTADTHAGYGALKGNIGKGQRGARGDDAEHIRVVDAVGGEQHVVDLYVVVVALGEERTYGTVGDAGGENLFLSRTRFALEESARKTTSGVELLTVFHLEREVIDAFTGTAAAGDGREQDGVGQTNGDRAGGLVGHAAGFDGQGLASAEID